MPAVSKAQSKFFRVVDAIQRGETKGSGEARKAAKEMSKGQVKDFIKTKTGGLPEHVKDEDCEAPVAAVDNRSFKPAEAPQVKKSASLEDAYSQSLKNK